MFRTFNDHIDVLVKFTKKGLLPQKFKWKNTLYTIESIDFVHTVTSGATLYYHFSVSTRNSNYKLVYNTKTLTWKLKETYYETSFEKASILNEKADTAYRL